MAAQGGTSGSVSLDSLPYVPYAAYNGTTPTGGDSLTQDLNVFYEVRESAGNFSSLNIINISTAE